MGFDIHYFKFKMNVIEMQLLIDSYFDAYKERCEISRLTGYSAVLAYRGKPLQFPWEKKQMKERTPVSEKGLKKLIEARLKIVNHGNEKRV